MPEEIDLNSILGGFSTKIRDLEEKQNLLKEKSLLLGQSFLKQEEVLRTDISELKDEIKELRMDVDRLKDNVETLIQEIGDFVRKDEFRILDKQMKIWDPLKFVREKDVKEMISEALRNFEEKEHPKHDHEQKDYIN